MDEEPRGILHLIGFVCVLAFLSLAWSAWRIGDWLSERAWWGRLA